MNVQFQVHHLALDTAIATAKFGIGKVNRADGLDRPSLDNSPVA